jgi:hypothetical protein
VKKVQRLYSFLIIGVRLGRVVNATLRPLYLPHPDMRMYPLYKKLAGPQKRSGRVWKTTPPPGFDPWIVQHIARCFID